VHAFHPSLVVLYLQDVELAVKSFYPTTWAANSFEALSGAPLSRCPPSPSSSSDNVGVAPKWDWTNSGNSSFKGEDFEDDEEDDDEDDDEGGDCVE